MNFYISDTHFFHHNIIRFDNRPFSSVEEMNDKLVENWNNVVTDKDTVYILGDFSWGNRSGTESILKMLNGGKVLIKGNHDEVTVKLKKYFEDIQDYKEVVDDGELVVMSHFPMPFWNHQFQNSVHLYGHVHNSHQWNMMQSWRTEIRELQAIPARIANVGCMIPYMDYTPRTLTELNKTAFY